MFDTEERNVKRLEIKILRLDDYVSSPRFVYELYNPWTMVKSFCVIHVYF